MEYQLPITRFARLFIVQDNSKNITQKIPKTILVLGLLIIMAGIGSIFLTTYPPGLFIFIVTGLALTALAMNYKNNGTERNAWDVWFFTMPVVVVALFFVGILGEAKDPKIWKWVAIALGGAAGLESLSSAVKEIKKS